ncbi:HigA family addiction module antitoxin [Novosphingobium sp. BL-8A]|uniref:HigA family addiction module antitoxin n=1 Tax=Novosphingobium sp. BL-8A TaxID=3127639 RepID=UPI00375837AD
MAIKVHSSFFVHPGPWLRTEFVEAYGLTLSAVAEALGVTRVAMSSLLNGEAALSAEMAMRFEIAFGVQAGTLMRMQIDHDLAQVRERAHELGVKRIAAAA